MNSFMESAVIRSHEAACSVRHCERSEAIQEVREPGVGTWTGAVNFLDRHGDLAVASR
jgi:hypothetical protein